MKLKEICVPSQYTVCQIDKNKNLQLYKHKVVFEDEKLVLPFELFSLTAKINLKTFSTPTNFRTTLQFIKASMNYVAILYNVLNDKELDEEKIRLMFSYLDESRHFTTSKEIKSVISLTGTDAAEVSIGLTDVMTTHVTSLLSVVSILRAMDSNAHNKKLEKIYEDIFPGTLINHNKEQFIFKHSLGKPNKYLNIKIELFIGYSPDELFGYTLTQPDYMDIHIEEFMLTENKTKIPQNSGIFNTIFFHV